MYLVLNVIYIGMQRLVKLVIERILESIFDELSYIELFIVKT